MLLAATGTHILAVDDGVLISALIADILIDNECLIVDLTRNVPEILVAAERAHFDAGVRDVNLKGVKVYPVA